MITTAFAEIVGLLCHYRQEKGDREALDHQKFIEWLEYHRHEEIKNLIVNTAALQTEIDNLLRTDFTVMLQKLEQIQDILIKLLGRTEEFKGLALAVAPNVQLSDQAISILRQFIESGDDKFSRIKWLNGRFTLQLSNRTQIQFTEQRYLEDDLNQLVALQLLSKTKSSDGTPTYGITRAAVRLMEAIDGKRAG